MTKRHIFSGPESLGHVGVALLIWAVLAAALSAITGQGLASMLGASVAAALAFGGRELEQDTPHWGLHSFKINNLWRVLRATAWPLFACVTLSMLVGSILGIFS